MSDRQSAGSFEVEVTDPSPQWVTISHDGDKLTGCIKIEELFDLRYCIDRILARAGYEGRK